MPRDFPPRESGRIYLTEAGTETEVMYKWGYDLPHFAMFTLLENPEAVKVMQAMFRRYFDAAEEHGAGMVVCGVDYRASPDWAQLLGYSLDGLAEMQERAIAFLTGLRDEYRDRVDDVYVGGCIGPRGDAYSLNKTITEAEAEDYHSVQLETLKKVGADLACAMTFNSVPEAIGVARAAKAVDMPLGLSFTLDSSSRLASGPSLREAIETVDAETGGAPDFYGVNCSHPVEFEPAFEPGDWAARIRYVRPNASKMEKIALCKLGHLEDGDPVELGQQMTDLAGRYPGMDILGGCCGTDERHLAEIARGVRALRACA
ncbi:homocysteine S-methyltransferase family protein [Ostreiculturibacter nitratireducens]|uniref:homocysteine S-methyltransferase family protein n=1 Tax=Ostreiculturibacter nitratireducens TaxID=3075226 RepID=UPI0031B5A46E